MRKACENPGDPRFVVWPMLLEAHAVLVDTLEKELQAAGGPPLGWYDVLVQLSMSPEGRLPMKELAESVLLSKSGVTRLVDRMEKEGYIERDPDASDRRVVYARLTPKGRAMFRKVSPKHIACVERHFADVLTETEAVTMRKALEKIIALQRSHS